MTTTRFRNGSTHANLDALLRLIQGPQLSKVIFFASPPWPTLDISDQDGPEVNLPLLVALVEDTDGDLLVFDGLFLHAQRRPRRAEVDTLLIAAAATNRAWFCDAYAPFTSAVPPVHAARTLLAMEPFTLLNATTLPDFVTLLTDAPAPPPNADLEDQPDPAPKRTGPVSPGLTALLRFVIILALIFGGVEMADRFGWPVLFLVGAVMWALTMFPGPVVRKKDKRPRR